MKALLGIPTLIVEQWKGGHHHYFTLCDNADAHLGAFQLVI